MKKVFYIGKSAGGYHDLGVNQVTGVDWTLLETQNWENCNLFAQVNHANNALIYGCSRLQPFRYNGLCYENCSWFVFYDNGFERCIDKECNYTLNLSLVSPQNWQVCIECEKLHFDLNGMLICRQSCLPT